MCYPQSLECLATHIQCANLPELTCQFLYDQLRSDADPLSDTISVEDCPEILSHIHVYHSAVATFYAPSDISGIRGMRWECIRSTPSWHKRPCQDCAFVVEDDNQPGFSGMSVVHILLFFSFVHEEITYPCALVWWFKKHGRHPDKKTGLWIVKPEVSWGQPVVTVIHLHSLFHGAHIFQFMDHMQYLIALIMPTHWTAFAHSMLTNMLITTVMRLYLHKIRTSHYSGCMHPGT